MGNYKMLDYLSNEYALGELGRSYGGNYNNQYINNSYNNYANDVPVLRNNIGGAEMIARYSNNPTSVAQQSRFNEVANELLDQSNYLSELEANKTADFVNTLSNTFSRDDGKGVSSRYQQFNRPQHSRGQQRMLNSYAPREHINDGRSDEQLRRSSDEFDVRTSNRNVEGFTYREPTFKQERDYRNSSYIETIENRKQLTLIITALLVGAFILFMMMQIYSNQKKLEYIVGIYAATPRHSPYYNIYANDSEMSY